MEVTPFDEAFGKLFADGMKWFDEQFPIDPKPVPPPFGPPQTDPVKSLMSGFAASRAHMVPPAFWDQHLRLDAASDPLATDSLLIPRKLATYIEVPDELLMDCGVIPDTRPPLPPVPWHYRLRSKLSDWREQAARRAFKLIAGYWPDNGEDDW